MIFCRVCEAVLKPWAVVRGIQVWACAPTWSLVHGTYWRRQASHHIADSLWWEPQLPVQLRRIEDTWEREREQELVEWLGQHSELLTGP